MKSAANKTKIVCTIGPASEAPEVLSQMILAGMNIARLNFSHGELAGHRRVIENIRAAARLTGRRVAIFGDLPGPKIRIGQLREEPVTLQPGDPFTLTTEELVGDHTRATVTLTRLPLVVRPGHVIFLNDGIIQLEVVQVVGNDVNCRVLAGGELRSKKGVNLPGIDLGTQAFTEHDRACLAFAVEQGLDAVSQSFVESAADIHAVREAARGLGHNMFIIAKIERSGALANIDAIFAAADGVMIARGDLGVELPIEQIPEVQKRLTFKANLLGKPVITATQMLESMTESPRPTRAEVTDVANAILDGTDCVMLSGESAIGKYPIEAVTLLRKVARAIEPSVTSATVRKVLQASSPLDGPAALAAAEGAPILDTPTPGLMDLIALSVVQAVDRVRPGAVLVPTRSGASARNVTRFRLPVWIVAVSSRQSTCQRLQFSYGVYPQLEAERPEDWKSYAGHWLQAHGLDGRHVILTGGPSEDHPDANYRMELLELDTGAVLRSGAE